jgi:ornithine cyclodeaminase
MRFVDAAEIRKLLTFPILIDALEAAHRRPKMEALDGMMGDEKQLYFVRSAVDRGRFMASKMITSFPANLAGGALPAVQAVTVLFDGSNGQPLAVMDGTELTYWRTAADSGLGARLLAPLDPKTLLVVGAGEMSRWLVRSHRAARPSLQRVLIWNRTAKRAAEVAKSLAAEGVAAEAVDDLDGATRMADVITTCTRSHAPLVKGANLKPGAHLDLVGGYTPETREADDEAARRSLIFVDRRESAFHGVGDILGPIASGAIREADVQGDLYDLAPGKIAGRRSPTDITYFKNAGGGHLDLMTAETVFRLLARNDTTS